MRSNLFTLKGFIDRYYHYASKLKCSDAYDATEQDYYELYGVHKYANYDTFRVILSRYNNSRKIVNNVNKVSG